MYEYSKGNYVYYGNKECGSPIREIKSVSEKEYNFWNNLDRKIKMQERNK